MSDSKPIPPAALDGLAVAPPDPDQGENNAATPPRPGPESETPDPQANPRRHTGQDPAIAERLARHPHNRDAQLDEALDETMDASDPPSLTQPGSHLPPPRPVSPESEGEH